MKASWRRTVEFSCFYNTKLETDTQKPYKPYFQVVRAVIELFVLVMVLELRRLFIDRSSSEKICDGNLSKTTQNENQYWFSIQANNES